MLNPKPVFSCAYVAEQIQKLFVDWGVTEPLPNKTGKVLINLPNGRLATVVLAKYKSTYGTKLYLLEMFAKEN